MNISQILGLNSTVFGVIVVVLFAIVLILMAVKVVTQGMNYTVERFGKYTRTFSPGLHFIIPFINSINRK